MDLKDFSAMLNDPTQTKQTDQRCLKVAQGIFLAVDKSVQAELSTKAAHSMLSDRDTINKFGLQIKQALLDQGTPQEKEGSSLEASPVTLDDVQKRVDQMEDALVVRESLGNLEGQGQSGDVAAILSDQQIKVLQSSRNLAEAGVTASQKQQLIQSIVSRHEERSE